MVYRLHNLASFSYKPILKGRFCRPEKRKSTRSQWVKQILSWIRITGGMTVENDTFGSKKFHSQTQSLAKGAVRLLRPALQSPRFKAARFTRFIRLNYGSTAAVIGGNLGSDQDGACFTMQSHMLRASIRQAKKSLRTSTCFKVT